MLPCVDAEQAGFRSARYLNTSGQDVVSFNGMPDRRKRLPKSFLLLWQRGGGDHARTASTQVG